jgi:NAD(P)-dependent dehydrogenase (short-subunit alcohol dehydrogenase family)
MKNSVVLITGALTGIGRATAFAFARENAKVVVSGRRDEAGEKLVEELRHICDGAHYIRADVRNEDDVKHLIEETAAHFGRLDVAVNNAGAEGQLGPVSEQTVESYATAFGTNVLGTMLCLKHELLQMQGQRSGVIINLSSTLGHKAAPGTSMYTASKHAVEGLTKVAALEAAAFGVRVNAVAPGPVETQMFAHFAPTAARKEAMVAGVPMKRAGTTQEVADAILFLSSKKAEFITGHILSVDGGRSAT